MGFARKAETACSLCRRGRHRRHHTGEILQRPETSRARFPVKNLDRIIPLQYHYALKVLTMKTPWMKIAALGAAGVLVPSACTGRNRISEAMPRWCGENRFHVGIKYDNQPDLVKTTRQQA